MTRELAPLFFFSAFVALSALACDTASVYEDCTSPAKLGSGEERCVPSLFNKEDERAREVDGFVSTGMEHVTNVLVRVGDLESTTDTAGLYHIPDAPFRYDVVARLDQDVVAYHEVGYRFLDIAVDRDVAPRVWSSRVRLSVENPPPPGHAFAFFVAGDNVMNVTGSLADGLVVTFRDFEEDVKLHVVAYPEAAGIVGAVAKGEVDVHVRANQDIVARVTLDPLDQGHATTFDATMPSGFVPGDCEILLDFGSLTSQASVTHVALGASIALPLMPAGAWTVRLRATRDGAVAASGNIVFAPGTRVDMRLFDPPQPVAPAPDGVATGGVVTATGTGVFEHLLVPEGGGRTIHVITTANDAAVPDLTKLELPPAHGRYTWTVRSFPDFSFVDQLSGIFPRLVRAQSESAPRTIVIP